MTSLLRRVAWRARAIAAPRPRILVYHRVAPAPQPDSFGMHVAPGDFSEHLRWLRAHYHPLPMAQFVEAWTQKEMPRNAVVLTFDDGYADNMTHALPLLERFNVPATFFVSTGYIGGRREFWWDALDRLLQPGTGVEASIREALDLSSGRFAGAALFAACRNHLLAMPVARRETLLTDWHAAAGLSEACRETHQVLDQRQLATLANHPLAEIGAHSVSHPGLTYLNEADQLDEVLRSRTMLAEQTGGALRYFAYPFGACDAGSESAVRQAGFDYAFTTEWAPVTHSAVRWRMPRLMISGKVERLARALSHTA